MKKIDNLKEQTKKRFIDDIITASGKEGVNLGIILILDQNTANILTSCMTLSELILAGITAVESIEKVRKPFPTFKAVYFITPNKENIDRLQADFDPKRIYKSQNVFFSRQMSDINFQILTSKSFSKKLGCLKEFNLDYFPISDNVFKSQYKDSFEYQADSLLSVVATHQDVSQIEVYKLNSTVFKEAAQVFQLLNPKLKTLFPYLNSTGKGVSIKLYIFERNMDLVSPLIHDFHYESMLADFMEGEVKIFSDNLVQKEDQTTIKINSNDKIYKKFRYEFIKHLMTGISDDFNLFMKENATAKAQKNKDAEMGLNQMQNVVRGIGEYNEMIKQFKMHVDLSKRIMDKITKNSLREGGNIELTVATGISDVGETVNAKNRFNLAKKFWTGPNGTPEDKLRMALIANGSLFKPDFDCSEGFFGDQKRIMEKHKVLISGFGKHIPDSSYDEYLKLVKQKYDKSESDLQRYISRAEYLVFKSLMSPNLTDFDIVKHEQPNGLGGKKGFANPSNNLFKAKINVQKQETVESIIIVYFVGGVSFLEVCGLMKLAKESKTGIKMLIGSTSFQSPADFIQSRLV